MQTNSGMMDMMMNQARKMMWSVVEYKDLQMVYTCAMKEIETKLDILSTEFNLKYKRNPISSVTSRLKRTESIAEKLSKNGFAFTIENIEKNVRDVAGIRVICSYIDDIYAIADALLKQDDVRLVEKKDYIANPKPNGYRSLHLIISTPVYLADSKKEVMVEVQIRTIAMDFWASLEHQIKYKKDIPDHESVCSELKACADVIAATDAHMLKLREKIESAEDTPTEDDMLFERLRKLDMPIM
jgi:putative GTP pyrophosphokinase